MTDSLIVPVALVAWATSFPVLIGSTSLSESVVGDGLQFPASSPDSKSDRMAPDMNTSSLWAPGMSWTRLCCDSDLSDPDSPLSLSTASSFLSGVVRVETRSFRLVDRLALLRHRRGLPTP